MRIYRYLQIALPSLWFWVSQSGTDWWPRIINIFFVMWGHQRSSVTAVRPKTNQTYPSSKRLLSVQKEDSENRITLNFLYRQSDVFQSYPDRPRTHLGLVLNSRRSMLVWVWRNGPKWNREDGGGVFTLSEYEISRIKFKKQIIVLSPLDVCR